MGQVVLDVRGAVKRFGSTEALTGVDLELRRGEWLGLLGPNGAGKTTLVRSIYGRCRLDAGTVRLLDASMTDGGGEAARARARLGVVPQEVALYPLLTVRCGSVTSSGLLSVSRVARKPRMAASCLRPQRPSSYSMSPTSRSGQ